jgi:thiol-disulfide isomerase/thioredoxin
MTRSSRLLLGITAALGLGAACVDLAHGNPAAVAAGDVVLLNFSASWCGPCRQMAPLVGEITAAGWVVRHVDVDGEGDLVRRFAVSGVPCYVLLVKGQEVGRINGATTRGELENLLAKSRQPLGLAPAAASSAVASLGGIPLSVTPTETPLSTEAPARPLATSPAIVTAGPPPASTSQPDRLAPPRARQQARGPAVEQYAAAGSPPLDPAQRATLERRLLSATARLLVEDSQGVSRGTGTVIDCRQGEALILTCGHIFRDSQGKGRVEVDLFGDEGPRGLAGQVVAWDLKRDLALVSIFTDRQIEPVRVGGVSRSTNTGEPVVTVGCNGGDDPTIHHSRVTAVDKYLGPANVQVAGQPVQGRSGGGLFAIDGTLIGVCNAADPADNEGLFAALPTIHEQLDEAGLAFVYRSVYPSGGAGDVAAATSGPLLPSMPAEMPPVSFDRRDRADALPTAATALNKDQTTVQNAVPNPVQIAAHNANENPADQPGHQPPRGMPPTGGSQKLSPGEQALIDHVWRHDGDAEVICIVRPRGGQPSPSDVFVLQGTGREFVEQLSKSQPGGHSAPHHAAPAATRSDVAALPAVELTR